MFVLTNKPVAHLTFNWAPPSSVFQRKPSAEQTPRRTPRAPLKTGLLATTGSSRLRRRRRCHQARWSARRWLARARPRRSGQCAGSPASAFGMGRWAPWEQFCESSPMPSTMTLALVSATGGTAAASGTDTSSIPHRLLIPAGVGGVHVGPDTFVDSIGHTLFSFFHLQAIRSGAAAREQPGIGPRMLDGCHEDSLHIPHVAVRVKH